MADTVDSHDDLISQFIGITGAPTSQARELLAAANWDLEAAATAFWNPEEETEEAAESAQPQSSPPQPIPTTSSMPPAPAQAPNKKFATLGDLRGSGAGGGHADHGHDDDSDGSDENQDLYTGGEKSGLAVENPDDLKKSIIARAKKNIGRPGGDDPRSAQSHFRGTARTLGGDDTPSEVIEDPTVIQPSNEPVERRLHFWADGFSVDDGPLYNVDDPQNAAVLAQIKQGRAPLSIMNLRPDQQVDVKIESHPEKYVPPKKKYQPFSSGGQRLGSPTPGAGTGSKTAQTSTAAAPATSSTANAEPTPPNVNPAEPTIQLQIRISDGTRMVSRFNITNTIGDVYDFVNSASAASRSRSWALMTTFPSVELQDKSKKLEDIAELRRGGTVIQKWK